MEFESHLVTEEKGLWNMGAPQAGCGAQCKGGVGSLGIRSKNTYPYHIMHMRYGWLKGTYIYAY